MHLIKQFAFIFSLALAGIQSQAVESRQDFRKVKKDQNLSIEFNKESSTINLQSEAVVPKVQSEPSSKIFLTLGYFQPSDLLVTTPNTTKNYEFDNLPSLGIQWAEHFGKINSFKLKGLANVTYAFSQDDTGNFKSMIHFLPVDLGLRLAYEMGPVTTSLDFTAGYLTYFQRAFEQANTSEARAFISPGLSIDVATKSNWSVLLGYRRLIVKEKDSHISGNHLTLGAGLKL